jgi:hypothetical protein
MCLATTNLRATERWNWDGGKIIQGPVVPSSRPVAGVRGSKSYPIDPREFLVTDRNAVMGDALHHGVRDFVEARSPGGWAFLQSHEEGSFDFRATMITAFLTGRIRYRSAKRDDPWRFPDETIFLGYGDCEDFAFLLASMLLASGISPYNVRVALGRVRLQRGTGRATEVGHVWVMYKDEGGLWMLLDPLLMLGGAVRPGRRAVRGTPREARAPLHAEYVPWYLLNADHLWEAAPPDARAGVTLEEILSQRFSQLKPAFAGEVHRTILNDALGPVLAPADRGVLVTLNAMFSRAVFGIAGPIVDVIDRDVRHYHPFDHFDNAYVKESWERVNANLALFAQDPARQISAFAKAAHAIADFYAHTSYGVFAPDSTAPDLAPRFDLCDPADPAHGFTPDYGAGSSLDLASEKFSVNPYYWKQGHPKAAAQWRGQLISGRYAQKNDTQGDIIDKVFAEGPAQIPAELLAAPDFFTRGAVPHHNEIAVDDVNPGKEHRLFDKTSYAKQFERRKNTAIAHVRKVFVERWHAAAPA